ncbi:MAG: ABC transporter substrate-binding protein [Candidatus Limiplasma sp.]|nr:ABC transporter substrate-binding protein [Candidatus Limiplasma sp.]
MSKRLPALILCAIVVLVSSLLLSGCSRTAGIAPARKQAVSTGPDWGTLAIEKELPLQYATQFTVTKYKDGYALIDIADSGRYLVVPQRKAVPTGLDANIVVLIQPLDCMYLAATSVMDFFRAVDGVGNIRLSGEDADGWYIDEAKRALEDGSMLFAGKYSAPDYELIYSEGCDLAIESTMIYHTPEVKEQLEKLGVPVLIERSSYEGDPLGRMEWLKLYGVLLGKEELAEKLFDREVAAVKSVLGQANTGRTVAFFYITTTGTVNVRKSGDYVAKMIEMAGGEYIFTDLKGNGNALSTINMSMESFYADAKNADVLIYNSTIGGELQTMDELLAKSPLLSDFKAVKSGDVWCTGKNLFQEPMGLGKLILDIHTILTEDARIARKLSYLHRLTDGGASNAK